VLIAASLMYEGGMLLNDAFDRMIDARERPERPIPAGRVAVSGVFAGGFASLGLGWLWLWPAGNATMAAGAVLATAIVGYDLHHKGVSWSPLVMGACRALVYLAAGLAVTAAMPADRLLWAALALAAYVAGLSYAAKQENLAQFAGSWPLALLAWPLPFLVTWLNAAALPFLLLFLVWTAWSLAFLFRREGRDTRRAVEGLIAGIALLDAVFIAESGSVTGAGAAVAAFLLTHVWQRRVPGT
jgi:heme O synthase-like polyprenyltransferase